MLDVIRAVHILWNPLLLSLSPQKTVAMLLPVALIALSYISVFVRGDECTPFTTFEQNCDYNLTNYSSTLYMDPPHTDIPGASQGLSSLLAMPCAANVSDVSRFGCAAFFPRCEDRRGPCRSLCDRVIQECNVDVNVPLVPPEFVCSRYDYQVLFKLFAVYTFCSPLCLK